MLVLVNQALINSVNRAGFLAELIARKDLLIPQLADAVLVAVTVLADTAQALALEPADLVLAQ